MKKIINKRLKNKARFILKDNTITAKPNIVKKEIIEKYKFLLLNLICYLF